MKKRIWNKIYILLFLIICILPFAGMSFAKTTSTTENKQLSKFPKIEKEGVLNKYYLQDMGNYLTEHFAFRQELVTADALIRSKVFDVSSADSVVVGKENWLYYDATIDDFLGQNLMTGRELYNAAHNIGMMQRYLEEQGATFLFTVAPNKNSLYGENMPYYYQKKASKTDNITNLLPFLEKEKIHYVDLFKTFREKEETLYHIRDSHWNNKGALLVYNTLMDGVGKEHNMYEGASYEVRKDFIGDLDRMLYPLATNPEDEVYYDINKEYEFISDYKSQEDFIIQTQNDRATGSLVMYRDSFGNTLLPFISNAYGSAFYSRLVPYNTMDLERYKADTVIVERVERHLPLMAKEPPIMEGPKIDIISNYKVDGAKTTCTIQKKGMNWVVSGELDGYYMDIDSKIFVKIAPEGVDLDTVAAYEAFPITVEENGKRNDYGYQLYLKEDLLNTQKVKMEIIIQNRDQTITLRENVENLNEEEINE